YTAPHFYESSYSISTKLTVPKEQAQGILVSYGSRLGGFALYAKSGRLVYEANDGFRHSLVTSDTPLAAGNVAVSCEFVRTPAPAGGRRDLITGTVRLFIDGRKVGEESGVSWTTYFPAIDGGTFGIGRAYGSPVSDAFDLQNSFNGSIESVRVQLYRQGR